MEGEVEKITITGCFDCPMKDMNDFSAGYTCKIVKEKHNDGYIKEHRGMPVTPEWCPIKKKPLLITY